MDKTKVNSIDELRRKLAANELSDDELSAVSGGFRMTEKDSSEWANARKTHTCHLGVTENEFPARGRCWNTDCHLCSYLDFGDEVEYTCSLCNYQK